MSDHIGEGSIIDIIRVHNLLSSLVIVPIGCKNISLCEEDIYRNSEEQTIWNCFYSEFIVEIGDDCGCCVDQEVRAWGDVIAGEERERQDVCGGEVFGVINEEVSTAAAWW